MKQLSFEYSMNAQQKELQSREIQNLLKMGSVQSFLRKYQLPESFVEDNYVDFSHWIEILQKCDSCAGLSFCRQAITGKALNLFLDETGYLDERYEPCRYLKEASSKLSHKSSYRFSHMSSNDYLIDLSEIDFQQEANSSVEYMQCYMKVSQSLTGKKGIYLYGQPGVGKSYLMMGVCNNYAKQGIQVSFVKVPLMMQDLKQSFKDEDYFQSMIGHMRFSKVLVLDDIGAESVTPWTRDDILFPILDYRMNHHLKTYFTSNYEIQELENQYITDKKQNERVAAGRIIERIKALSNVVALTGSSRR